MSECLLASRQKVLLVEDGSSQVVQRLEPNPSEGARLLLLGLLERCKVEWLEDSTPDSRTMAVFAEELEEEKENPTEIELTEKQKHQLRHRELFLSRQYESLPATHIR